MPLLLPVNQRRIWALALIISVLSVSCRNSAAPPPDGPIISLSTTQLNFYGAAAGGNPPRQMVLVRNTGVDSLHFTATHQQSWLDLSIVPGTGADSIFVYAYISGFTTGVYYDTITVTSDNALNSPRQIAVTATVQADISVSPPVLLFESLVSGPDPDPQFLTIHSTGADGLTFTATKTKSWLTLSKTSGNTPDQIAVGVTNIGLTSGTYRDTIVIATSSLVTPLIRIPISIAVRSWSSFTISGSNDLRGVDIIDDSTAVAVGFIGNASGHTGVILKTKDAGRSWDARKYVNYSSLGGVDFIDASFGWVVGDSGMILYTSDGGETWDRIPKEAVPTKDTLAFWRVKFADHANGWIIGVKGILLRTVDSGKTWAIQPPPATFSLADLEIKSSTSGWIVGNHGTILRTTDGSNWVAQNSQTIVDLWAISMIDELKGWVVGINGAMFYTADGGVNWEPKVSGETTDLKDIFFVDESTGWAVGDRGVIIRYQPATKTWWRQNSGSTRTLFNCAFTASGYGVVVGELGTILLTYNGGL